VFNDGKSFAGNPALNAEPSLALIAACLLLNETSVWLSYHLLTKG
jgi:hypothetical protein